MRFRGRLCLGLLTLCAFPRFLFLGLGGHVVGENFDNAGQHRRGTEKISEGHAHAATAEVIADLLRQVGEATK